MAEKGLPTTSFNHISRNCRDLNRSLDFYVNVVGFELVKRPQSLDGEGAWLYKHGIGIHLLHWGSERSLRAARPDADIDPKADHISFQADDVDAIKRILKEAEIRYINRVVEEKGIKVEQIFFHDPDGYMIEICTCQRLPIEPLPGGASALLNGNGPT